jgi:hypothetical protein
LVQRGVFLDEPTSTLYVAEIEKVLYDTPKEVLEFLEARGCFSERSASWLDTI